MEILESLNEEQREALLNIEGANLVTAGAGTGKTKLLTHRIAYLIEELKVDPYNILAITFTNKASNEMKERIAKLCPDIATKAYTGDFLRCLYLSLTTSGVPTNDLVRLALKASFPTYVHHWAS
jgi:DNA helicase-2/ATP-dependent DNA helicase PcrA